MGEKFYWILESPLKYHDKNVYDVLPFFTYLENEGISHGILTLDSIAMV